MSSIFAWLTLSLLSILFTTTTTTGQFLEAEYLNIKLPYANACPTPHYDGEDSIYLFGGCTFGRMTDILKFSVSTETLQVVGSLPGNARRGTLQSDNFGNIFYFCGGDNYQDVYKFDPISNTTTTVATLPYEIFTHISTKYSGTSNSVFMFALYDLGNEVLSFDMESLLSTVVTNLPFYVNGGTSVRVGTKVYIFDNVSHNKMVLELDLDTFDLQPVGPPTLPLFQLYPSSVYDGNHAYVIGGYSNTGTPPTNGLIQFDPSTYENNFIAVRNFPVEGLDWYSDAPASVFVASKNRIYFFGGTTVNGTTSIGTTRDDIFYIDMPPTDLFSCSGRPNGVYPHPTDCSLFIGCHDEEMTVFSCPPPLLFDPTGLRCDFPDAVTCST